MARYTDKIYSRERTQTVSILCVTTLIFASAVLLVVLLVKNASAIRLCFAENALSKGNYSLASSLTEGMDEDTASDFTKRLSYALALSKKSSGELEDAETLFRSLGDYLDSYELANECAYSRGEEYLEADAWQDAADLFHSIAGFRDAAEKEKLAKYSLASQLVGQSDGVSAFIIYEELGEYEDAYERALELACELIGEPDIERAKAFAENLSEEEVALRRELGEYRETLPVNIIAVGFYHTVAVKSDGTVLACGDNSYGQCEVSDLAGVKEVAAGAYHTAVLLNDGTVRVSGRTDENQGDVSQWTDIEHIAAADYATFGLKSDGTVVYCGYYDYYMLLEWTGITKITGGSYAVAGLRNGEALISHVTARSDCLKSLADIAVTTGFALGLKENGTVVSGQIELEWKNIAAVCASTTCCLGLKSDGTVMSYFFRAADAIDMSSLKNVIAMSAGATHSAFVCTDGTVTVLGDESLGQADTSAWMLF